MNNKILRTGLLIGTALMLASSPSRSDDIDIFLSQSGSVTTGKPNVMILVDNTANWSRAAQAWPDNGGDQGAAEMAAVGEVVSGVTNMNIGLAGYTQSGNGGYVRFGVRDMGVSANQAALVGITSYIKGNINSTSEKVNVGSYETSAMFEMYRYFKGLNVYRGAKVNDNDPAKSVDIAGNEGSGADTTAHRWGLSTGHAYTGSTYNAPAASTGCTTNALIMVINNRQGKMPEGEQSYDSVSAGSALPQISGVTEASWTDEWARFLYQSGISVYILDAYNAQRNVSYSKTLERAALVGGGGYFAVKNQEDILIALTKILAEINAKDSTFASAALPVSATNRAQYLNQVFIGMFRPDPDAEPRWLGNLKRYSLALTDSGAVQLSDVTGADAINPATGFIDECAVSEWTSDSGSFWQGVKGLNMGASDCSIMPTVGSFTGSAWSDMPDGPSVAKGGVAEVIRKGNNPPSTNTTPAAWALANRNILTYDTATSTTTALTASLAGWSSDFFNWVTGRDDNQTVDGLQPYSEYFDTSTTDRVRPSIHGDVIHSRPLAVNYGTDGVTIYYGANDGMFRAVDASTGKERWAFVAPEHYTRFQRLKDNTPPVAFQGFTATPTPVAKDYFFDGSTGLYQSENNSAVWIYPSQRRGGRMLYGINVTDPDSPEVAWRVGCPNLTNDTGCTHADFAALGQTWSQPTVAMVKNHSNPVLIVGGGYDSCEDADVRPGDTGYDCSSRKGNAIYVLDAFTGAILRRFTFAASYGSVAADISLADRNGDGKVDFAYAVTTAGAVFRINFTDATYGSVLTADWGNRLVGYTSSSGRKFLNAPALMPSGTDMYVALGSGDREKPLADHYPYTTPVTNRFYVLLDDVADPAVSPTPVNMDDETVMKNYSVETTCSTGGVGPGTDPFRGWFIDLPLAGEQTTTSAIAVAGMVTFSTNRPIPIGSAADTCSANLGEARGYWLNLLNASGAIGVGNATCGGDRSAAFVQGGLVPSPTLVTVQIGDAIQTVALGAVQRSGGASSGIAPQAISPAIKAKRRVIYWRSKRAE